MIESHDVYNSPFLSLTYWYYIWNKIVYFSVWRNWYEFSMRLCRDSKHCLIYIWMCEIDIYYFRSHVRIVISRNLKPWYSCFVTFIFMYNYLYKKSWDIILLKWMVIFGTTVFLIKSIERRYDCYDWYKL